MFDVALLRTLPPRLAGLSVALAGCLYALAADAADAADFRLIPTDASIGQCLQPVPDFSYAGYRNGMQEIPAAEGQVIDVRDYGVVPDDGRDDSAALLKAMDAARQVNGPVVVQLPAGRVVLSEILHIDRSDIVLRGQGRGEGGTELYFPRPLRLVDKSQQLKELREYLVKNDKYQKEPQNNVHALFSEYSWTGGFLWVGPRDNRPAPYLTSYDRPSKETRVAEVKAGRQGALTVQLTPGAKLKQGDVVQLRWFNRSGPNGALISELFGPDHAKLKVGANHWEFPDRALAVQTVRIDALDGDTATISSPLLHDVNASLPADVARWQHLSQVGIEDIGFVFPEGTAFGHHQEEGYNAIYFTGVYDGWVRNIRTRDADSGVLTYDSANLTIADVLSEGRRHAHYAVHVGNVNNVLVRDVEVFNPVIHTFSINTQASRNVFLRARSWQEPVIDQHAGANHQNLFDQLTLHVHARRDKAGKPFYPVWNGSGAGYWEPGHGRYNTTWNLKVMVESGAAPDETVRLDGTDEGPDARVVGVSGNRAFSVDYRPAPLLRALNQPLVDTPSLYELQLGRRKAGQPVPTCITP